jgi:hypothetical protein
LRSIIRTFIFLFTHHAEDLRPACINMVLIYRKSKPNYQNRRAGFQDGFMVMSLAGPRAGLLLRLRGFIVCCLPALFLAR